MGKIKILFITAILLCCAMRNHAAFRVVIDPYAIEAVTQNTAAQKVIENLHNKRLDSIKVKQEKIKKYTLTMAGIKELYKMTMQNITGFGSESKIYVEIYHNTVEIFMLAPQAIYTLNKLPIYNHLLCINEIQNLILETNQLVAAFVDIVNNGKVKAPMPDYHSATEGGIHNIGQGDGYNFLDRYQRYCLANKILTHLSEIRHKLQAIVFMCNYCNNINNLVFNIDVESWFKFFSAKNAVNQLINDWKGLSS